MRWQETVLLGVTVEYEHAKASARFFVDGHEERVYTIEVHAFGAWGLVAREHRVPIVVRESFNVILYRFYFIFNHCFLDRLIFLLVFECRVTVFAETVQISVVAKVENDLNELIVESQTVFSSLSVES